MRTITVPAIKDFTYRTMRVRKGQPVTCTPLEATALHRQGYVTLDRRTVERLEHQALEPETPAPVTLPPPDADAAPASDPPIRTRKRGTRTYRRRDLVADPG